VHSSFLKGVQMFKKEIEKWPIKQKSFYVINVPKLSQTISDKFIEYLYSGDENKFDDELI